MDKLFGVEVSKIVRVKIAHSETWTDVCGETIEMNDLALYGRVVSFRPYAHHPRTYVLLSAVIGVEARD